MAGQPCAPLGFGDPEDDRHDDLARQRPHVRVEADGLPRREIAHQTAGDVLHGWFVPCSALPMNAGVTLRRTTVWSSLAHHSMIRLPKTISCGANRRRPAPNDKARVFSWKTARTSSGDEVQNIVGKSGTSNMNRSPSAAKLLSGGLGREPQLGPCREGDFRAGQGIERRDRPRRRRRGAHRNSL